MSELIYKTATDLAGAIRRREVSAVEVVQAHLAQISKVNGDINAVVTVCEERALARARLKHPQLVLLDREFDVLHVAVVGLQTMKHVGKLLEDHGHGLFHG